MQLARFALVGSVGLVIDVSVFNVLRLTVLAPEVVETGPLIAKAISTSLAIVANWLGNRHWTFHREQRAHPAGEAMRFAAVSVSAMGIPLACLWVSHYALGFTSLLADNVSSNVVGLGLGMVFRFWLYRVWVFAPVELANAETSGATERPVGPAGFAPLRRIQTVSPVDDRRHANE